MVLRSTQGHYGNLTSKVFLASCIGNELTGRIKLTILASEYKQRVPTSHTLGLPGSVSFRHLHERALALVGPFPHVRYTPWQVWRKFELAVYLGDLLRAAARIRDFSTRLFISEQIGWLASVPTELRHRRRVRLGTIMTQASECWPVLTRWIFSDHQGIPQ